MTKIGEGDQPGKIPTQETYHSELEKSVRKFDTTLDAFSTSMDAADKTRFKAIMDEQMQLMQQAVNGIKLKEIHKQSEKVAKDYEDYIDSHSDQSFAALKHDLSTLQQYNQISTPKARLQ